VQDDVGRLGVGETDEGEVADEEEESQGKCNSWRKEGALKDLEEASGLATTSTLLRFPLSSPFCK
jgi:hypothetical protein